MSKQKEIPNRIYIQKDEEALPQGWLSEPSARRCGLVHYNVEYIREGIVKSERDELKQSVDKLTGITLKLTAERNELQRKLVDAEIQIHDLEESQQDKQQALANLCDRHKRGALPVPNAMTCRICDEERRTQRRPNMIFEGI